MKHLKHFYNYLIPMGAIVEIRLDLNHLIECLADILNEDGFNLQEAFFFLNCDAGIGERIDTGCQKC